MGVNMNKFMFIFIFSSLFIATHDALSECSSFYCEPRLRDAFLHCYESMSSVAEEKVDTLKLCVSNQLFMSENDASPNCNVCICEKIPVLCQNNFFVNIIS